MGVALLKNFIFTNIKAHFYPFIYYTVLGIPILIAGLIKFFNPSDFATALKYSFYLPDWLSIIIAILNPIAEIVIGSSLIFNLYRNISIILYRILLFVFLTFHIWNNFISLQKPCNCFGNLVEFVGIWMMVIISVFLFISFLPVKSKTDEDPFILFKKNFSKKKITIVASMIILILASGYMRWLKVEKELNAGLLASNNLSLINDKVNLLSKELNFDKHKYKIVLFLKSPTCGDCIEQLLFWNSKKYLEKFSIIGVFSKTIDSNIQIIENYYNLKVHLRKISYNLWKQMVGLSLAYSSLLLLDKNNTYVDYIVLSNMEELRDYAQKIENIKV